MKIKRSFLIMLLTLAIAITLAACGGNSTEQAQSDEVNENTSKNTASDSNAAADWPNKDIKIIVHSGPGNLDTGIRQAAKGLEEVLGVNVIVENKPGGSGSVAATVVQGEEADGYTFLSMTGSSSFSVASGQNSILNQDWPMVASMQKETPAVAVLNDSPLQTLDDFVAAMKEDPNQLVVGGYGSTGFVTYVYYKLQQLGGFEGTWIPIDTTDEVAVGLLGGHIDVAVMTPSTANSAVKNGDVRLLGIASDERSPNFPDVPTFKEQGYDFSDAIWRGMAAKPGTPEEAINKMHEALMKVSETDDWNNFQKQQNQENDPISPKELDERFAREISERTEFLKHLGLLQ